MDSARGPMEAGKNRTAYVIAMFGACLGVGLLIALQGVSNLWLLGAGVAVTPLLMLVDRRVLVYLCFLSSFTLDWLALDVGALPSQAQWLLEVCILILVIRSLAVAYRNGSLRLPAAILAVLLAFALSAIVGMTNGLAPLIVLMGMRKYLRFPIIALCIIIAPLGEGFERGLWRALLAAGGLQVAVSLWQLLTVGAGDKASGTFGPGGTGFEAIFLVSVASVVMLRNVLAGGRIRLADVGLGLALLVPTVIGSAVAAYFLVPACVVFGILAFGKRVGRTIAALAIAGVILAVLAPYAIEYTSSIGYVNASKLLSSPEAMLEYDQLATSQGRLGRVDQVLVAGSLTVGTDLSRALFGRGPGVASTSSLGPQFSGPLSTDALVRWVETSVAVTLLEMGLVGLAAFTGVAVYAIVISIRAVRAHVDPDEAIIAAFAAVSGFLMLAAGAYSVPWTIPGVALPFWVALGTVMSRRSPSPAGEGT